MSWKASNIGTPEKEEFLQKVWVDRYAYAAYAESDMLINFHAHGENQNVSYMASIPTV